MTKAQEIFCNEYLIDLNATKAYKVAYSRCKKDETANVNGSKLLRNAKVQEYIATRMKEREKRTEITQDMVIKELGAIAFANGTDFAELCSKTRKLPIYENGEVTDYETEEYVEVKFKPTNKLTDEQKKAISGIKEGKFGIEVNLCDKVKALELLGRHLGIFNDKLDVNLKEKEEKKNAITDIISQMKMADDDEC